MSSNCPTFIKSPTSFPEDEDTAGRQGYQIVGYGGQEEDALIVATGAEEGWMIYQYEENQSLTSSDFLHYEEWSGHNPGETDNVAQVYFTDTHRTCEWPMTKVGRGAYGHKFIGIRVVHFARQGHSFV